jgi:hypothetical protein
MVVFDANAPGGRPVPVRYRLPETEVANLTYPIVIISHNGWYPANEREHRGYIQIPYAPEHLPTWWADTGPATTNFQPSDSPYYGYFPFPYNFDYTITFYTRMMHEHTIPLIGQLAAYDRLDPKFAFLDIPQDGTKRTMQLLAGPSLETGDDKDGKRIFWATYVVRVFSELVPDVVRPILTNLVNLDLSVYSDMSDLTGPQLAESKGLLSVGASSAWNVSST